MRQTLGENFEYQEEKQHSEQIISLITVNEQQSKHDSVYRADIDGLRTIAVGIVVIFHAWPLFMPGGFIGVDIFFVISGYLISGIIIKQTKKNKFSYIDFYSRRIKRIYPALILVLVFVLVMGARKLLKRPLQIMTQTMAASTVFAANIEILTAEHDYFGPDTKTNPLLHLWSLGVEEQFYIFWPLLLTIIIKKFQKKTFHILFGFTVLSFALSIVCVFINKRFDFYFPFCRFWQMSVGGMLAYLKLKIKNNIVNTFISLVSIISIVFTVWIIRQYSLFPGFWVLIPTLGAASIILAGSNTFINKNLLSSRPFVFIGKISYSLYLWHWPLLVFSRLLYPEGSKSIYAKPQVMILIAIVLSILSYHFLENPFRVRKQKNIALVLLIVMLLIGAASIWVYKNADQFEHRRMVKLSMQMQDEYQMNMIPQEQDFYTKDGRQIPNVSKNRKRQPPAEDKIKLSGIQQFIDLRDRNSQTLFSKRIGPESKYFRSGGDTIHHYEVSNEGRDKTVMLIGDSHARYVSYRLQKLYKDSVKNGNEQKFPTIINVIRQGSVLLPQDPTYNFTMNVIRELKPDRLFIVYRWFGKWSRKNLQKLGNAEDMASYFEDSMVQFDHVLKEIKSLGIEVYLSGIKPQGEELNPIRMKDENGVINDNVKPVSYRQFREKYKRYYEALQKISRRLDIPIVEFTDHMCYEDVCQVLTPTGYAINYDGNHQTKEFSENWNWVIDFLTVF